MRAKRVDQNHGEVIAALKSCGWYVLDTHSFPSFVDAVAYHPGREVLRLVEIKGAKGKLTASQAWLVQRGFPIQFLRSVDDAVNLR